MAKKSKTHTGQAGVVGAKPIIVKEVNDSVRGYGFATIDSPSKKKVMELIEESKKRTWSEIEKQFQEWLDDPIDGSKCSYNSPQRMELIKFFKSKFLQ